MPDIPDIAEILGWGGPVARPAAPPRPVPAPVPSAYLGAPSTVPAIVPRPVPSPVLASSAAANPVTADALRVSAYALLAVQQEVMAAGLRPDPRAVPTAPGARVTAAPGANTWAVSDALAELAELEGI